MSKVQMPVSTRHALTLIAALLVSACSHYSYDLGEPISEQQSSGMTTGLPLAEVLGQLGPPLRVSALPNGYVLAWEHWNIREIKAGFSLGFAGVEAMSMDWGDTATKGEFLLLTFDRHHHLVDTAFTQWSNDAGGGRSIQPFGGLLPVVDVDDLLERMPQHRWGASSLDDLPITLNMQSSPDTGHNGVEQRGTPMGSGQRVLEMN